MRTPAITFSPRRGRPRKFAEPSRAVTLTLPESVLDTLESIDRDVGRAVVRLAKSDGARRAFPPAELMAFGRRAVIVVNPTKTLERRTGVVLVPFSDGRALICFDATMTPARLELMIQDALEEHDLPTDDRRVFEGIRDVLKDARRAPHVDLRQQQIILLHFDTAAHRRAGVRTSRRRGGS